MVVFPNCKINIGLNVVGKRADGFHDIETVFYPVGLKDVLEIIENPEQSAITTFTQTGIAIPGETGDNLCLRALEILKRSFPQLPALQIHLHKIIPLGAGLGGGSSDGAFMLKLLNSYFDLNLSAQQLMAFALELGSDCPFFIINEPCFATGRGEIMHKIELDLSACSICLVNPGIHINTGWAFSQLTGTAAQRNLRAEVNMPVSSWREHIYNDFETPVFNTYPEIRDAKEQLYAAGALYASMTGSGSSLYGIFEKSATDIPNFPEHYFYKWV